MVTYEKYLCPFPIVPFGLVWVIATNPQLPIVFLRLQRSSEASPISSSVEPSHESSTDTSVSSKTLQIWVHPMKTIPSPKAGMAQYRSNKVELLIAKRLSMVELIESLTA